MPLVNSLGGQFTSNRTVFADGTSSLSNYLQLNGRSISIASGGQLNENAAVQLILAQMGADPNNKQRIALEKYLQTALTSAHSYQDYLNILSGARKNYMPSTFNSKWNNISSETAEEMTLKDIQSSQAYVLALRQNMEQVQLPSNFRQNVKFIVDTYTGQGIALSDGFQKDIIQNAMGARSTNKFKNWRILCFKN